MKKRFWMPMLILLSAVLLLAAGCGQKPATGTKETGAKKVDYPTKAITAVSHSSPGAGADLFCRQAGKGLQNVLGKPVVTENRSGGSGAIALQYVAEAAPDGYTMLGITDTLVITPLKNNVPKSLHDLKPVARLVLDGNVLYARADSKWTAESMINAITKGGEKVKWGAPQAGSPESVATDTLIKKYGAKINAVAYADGAKALTGVLNGDVDASMAEVAEILPQLEAKKVKVLLSFNSQRVPTLPDVPTFVEKGFPDIVVDKFRGFAVPKNTPDEVVKILEEAFKKAMDDPEYKKAYTANNQIPAYLNAADFQKFLNDTEAKYKAYFDAQKAGKK
ncbi:MAG: tripartite tricarboxylate transporter substrate binding protein [Bacillota bacterium]